MSLSDLKTEACSTVDKLRDQLFAVANEIHANPEVCFEEFKASRLIVDTLARHGITAQIPAFGLNTAFSAEFGRVDTPCVGLIAEYDALPGLGHACGHNIIGTAALGAALALMHLGERLPGRVRLLGTPAEEGGGGKEIMARRGAFEGLACAMMLHPATENLPTYPLIARAAVQVSYRGKAAHASAEPEAGINALDGLVVAYQAISTWRQHMPPGHRIHGIITDGGKAPNVIPDFAAGSFAIRAPTRAGLEMMRGRIEDCFRAGALASGAKVAIEWDDIEYLDLVTNWPLAKSYQKNAETLGRKFASVADLPASRAASTDMGNVSHLIPSIHPMIAAVPPNVAFHTHEFAAAAGSDMGRKAVIDGAKALAMTALDFLTDHNLQERVQAEFASAAHKATQSSDCSD
jgi:amidohydrolase